MTWWTHRLCIAQLGHWTRELDGRKSEILSCWPENDPATLVWNYTYSLAQVWGCFRVLQELIVVVAALGPLAHAPAMSLIHADFSFWKDHPLLGRPQSRGGCHRLVRRQHRFPVTIAALYPDELTTEASDRRFDPEDVFTIPPVVSYEDTGSWEVAIQEKGECGGRRLQELAAMYTDPRARLRRGVQELVHRGHLS